MSNHETLELSLAFFGLTVKSCLVVFFAWAVNRFLRRHSASTRHLIWVTAFALLLLLPLVTVLTPGTEFLVFKEPALSAPVTSESLPIELGTISTDELKEIQKVRSGQTTPVLTSKSVSTGPNNSAVVASTPVLARLLDYLLAIWMLGLIVVVFKASRGLVSIHRYRSKSSEMHPASPSIDLMGISTRVGIRRNWEFRMSTSRIPPAAMTWGVLRPVVLMPKDSDSWSQERLEAVLLHELAHVRRFDSMSQLIALATSALYWFNPLVWLCARAMRAEAETAADDTVLRMGIKPSDYASELLRIAAELGQRRQPFSHIGVSVMKQSKIESRVKAILDPSARRRRGVTLLEAVATMTVAAIVMMPLGALRPGLFQDSPSKPATPPAPSKVAPPARLSPPVTLASPAVVSTAPAQVAPPAIPSKQPQPAKPAKVKETQPLPVAPTLIYKEYALLFDAWLASKQEPEAKPKQEKLPATKAKAQADKAVAEEVAKRLFEAAKKMNEAARLDTTKESAKMDIDQATRLLFQSKLEEEKRNQEALALAQALKSLQAVNAAAKLQLNTKSALQDKHLSTDEKMRLDAEMHVINSQSEQLKDQVAKTQDQIHRARMQVLLQEQALHSLRDENLRLLELQAKLRESQISARLSEVKLRMADAKARLAKVKALHDKGLVSKEELAKAMASYDRAQSAFQKAEITILAAGKN